MKTLDQILGDGFQEKKTPINEQIKDEIHIWHFKRAFMGCFALFSRINCQHERLRKWKDKPLSDPEFTEFMAASIVKYATNKYEVVTAPPPNASRQNLEKYCTYLLARKVAQKLKKPFQPAFAQRKSKRYHGRFQALNTTEKPALLPSFKRTFKGKTVLFVDDFINTCKTANECYQALRTIDCSVHGLIYAYF